MADRPTVAQVTEWVNFEKREELLAADMTGLDMSGVQLWGGNLAELNFQNVNFTNANLFGSDMSGTDVRGADLATADLHRTSLKGAIYNDETRLPNEFATEVRGLIHERDLPEDESDEKAGD